MPGVSRPVELHPEALAETDVTLSREPARIKDPLRKTTRCVNSSGLRRETAATHRRARWMATCLRQTSAQQVEAVVEDRTVTRDSATAVLPFSYSPGSRHPDLRLVEAQSPGPPMPRSTLHGTPHDAPCKTRGQNGVATSFPAGDLHPLQHANYPGAQRMIAKPGVEG